MTDSHQPSRSSAHADATPLEALSAPPSSITPAGKGGRPILTWVLGGIVVVGAVLGGGFALGRATAPDTSPFPGGARQWAGGEGQGGQGGVGTLRSGVRGEITAVDGATLTVTAEDGTQTSVTTTDETSVTHTEVGDVSDLQVGDTVTVMGSGGEDDSSGVTALAISEGESMTMGAGFPGGAGGFTGERPDGFPTDMPGGGFPGGPDGGGAPEAPAQG